MPKESAESRKANFEKMAVDLLQMISELKVEYEKIEDKKLKKEVGTAMESLEKLKSKIEDTIH